MTWEDIFLDIKNKEYFKNLLLFLEKEYQNKIIFPSKGDIFNAFKYTPFNKVKVVILGQDPYIHKGQAHGLAFSVFNNKITPSLKNIYKEIENEFDIKMDYQNTNLSYLSNQGVLLLNTILTVEEGKSLSHKISEYEFLMQDIFEALESNNSPIIYLLWGNYAKKYKKYIKNPNHFVLEATHPSPLGANKGGWFNSNIFIKCNELLLKNNLIPIEWKN